jgi:hypothetical protein
VVEPKHYHDASGIAALMRRTAAIHPNFNPSRFERCLPHSTRKSRRIAAAGAIDDVAVGGAGNFRNAAASPEGTG